MLQGLGHNAFFGGDQEEHEVHAADAGEHVVDEFFVAGHVDNADVQMAIVGQGAVARINGNAALLFFF